MATQSSYISLEHSVRRGLFRTIAAEKISALLSKQIAAIAMLVSMQVDTVALTVGPTDSVLFEKSGRKDSKVNIRTSK